MTQEQKNILGYGLLGIVALFLVITFPILLVIAGFLAVVIFALMLITE